MVLFPRIESFVFGFPFLLMVTAVAASLFSWHCIFYSGSKRTEGKPRYNIFYFYFSNFFYFSHHVPKHHSVHVAFPMQQLKILWSRRTAKNLIGLNARTADIPWTKGTVSCASVSKATTADVVRILVGLWSGVIWWNLLTAYALDQ